MTDPTQTSPSSDLLDETLSRLSKKPGVKATLVIDRTSGLLIKTAGNTSTLQPVAASKNKKDKKKSNDNAALEEPGTPMSPSPVGAGSDGGFDLGGDAGAGAGAGGSVVGAVEYAGLVWRFVRSAGELVDNLEDEDELKLLRLRTKRYELVIVPDAKYLLVLVHDTLQH